MNKAIFLDRDGTVIRDVGYLSDPRGVVLYKSAKPAFAIFKRLNFKVFIVSNQSGVGRGYFKESDVKKVNARMEQLLAPYKIDKIVYCPHSPEEPCDCRKPNPFMGERLIRQYNIDVKRSFMAGDKKSDTDFGRNLGVKTILLRTSRGNGQIKKYGKDLKADYIARTLLSAAKYIEKKDKPSF